MLQVWRNHLLLRLQAPPSSVCWYRNSLLVDWLVPIYSFWQLNQTNKHQENSALCARTTEWHPQAQVSDTSRGILWKWILNLWSLESQKGPHKGLAEAHIKIALSKRALPRLKLGRVERSPFMHNSSNRHHCSLIITQQPNIMWCHS